MMSAFTTSQPYLQIVFLSLKIAFLAVTLAAPLSIGCGYVLAKWRFPGREFVNAIILLPLILPPVATGYLLLLFLGPNGSGGIFLRHVIGLELGFRWTGAAVAAAIMAFPLMVRPLRLAFEQLDDRLLDTAATLGASRVIIFFTISLPLALPGLIAGLILGFAKAMGEFGATITFVSNIPGETQTLSLAIYTMLQSPQGDHSALVLIAISLLISMLAVLLSEWLARRTNDWIGRPRGR